jgi:peptidoglycan/LPS O-acetylase OafA/YrhL
LFVGSNSVSFHRVPYCIAILGGLRMDKIAWAASAPNAGLSPQYYRPDIDGLRAVAVGAVIVFHFWNGLLRGGFLGVDIFFVISGHVITASLSKHSHPTRDLVINFYCRRIKRLLPALLVCLAVTGLFGALIVPPQSSAYSGSMKAGLLAIFGLSNIYFFQESSNYFAIPSSLNLFTHTWSLGVEEQFYVVFPLLLLITGYGSRRPGGRLRLLVAQGVLTVASLALYARLGQDFWGGAYFTMPPRSWELSIGSLTALACSRPPRFGEATLDRLAWLSLVAVVIALLIPAGQSVSMPAVVAGTAGLITTLRPGHLLHRLLTVRLLLLTGAMSYSLYLWHWSVLAIAHWTVGIHWFTAPFLLAAIIVLAASSFVFVERPLRRVKWSISTLGAAGYGLTAVAFVAGLFLVLQTALNGAFYAGPAVSMEARGVASLREDKFFGGVLQWRADDCILASNNDVGKEINADKCTLNGPQNPTFSRRFLVIGNSFSAAEYEMYAALADRGLGSVIATSTWGASPVPDLPNNSPWKDVNAYYWESVIPALIPRLGRGDVLIMINDLTPTMMDFAEGWAPERLAQLKKGLQRLADDLRPKGVQIIFQSQNPFMREARCVPEVAMSQWHWAGALSPCHYYSRSASIQRIRPLSDILEDVQRAYPNFHVLDLFPVMCPGNVCRFDDDQGTLLYRDEFSHPSVEANHLARPVLLSVVNSAVTPLRRGDGTAYHDPRLQ